MCLIKHAGISTPYLRHIYTISTPYLRHIYTISTPYLHHFYAISTSFLRHIYTISTPYLHHFYAISTSFLRHIYTISTPYLHHFYAISTPYLRHIYTITTLQMGKNPRYPLHRNLSGLQSRSGSCERYVGCTARQYTDWSFATVIFLKQVVLLCFSHVQFPFSCRTLQPFV
jgi:hypothetical protein